MGIYQIKNKTSGRIFIGSSKNLNAVFNSVRLQLKTGTFINRSLQEDFTIKGEAGFDFEILDRLEPREDPLYDYSDDLIVLEQMWMEKLEPYDDKGYHKRPK